MIYSKKRITKALVSLRWCSGWSAPVLFTNPRRQIFSRRSPNNDVMAIFIMRPRQCMQTFCPHTKNMFSPIIICILAHEFLGFARFELIHLHLFYVLIIDLCDSGVFKDFS